MVTTPRCVSRFCRRFVIAAAGVGLVAVPAFVTAAPNPAAAGAKGEPIVLGNVASYTSPQLASPLKNVSKPALQAWAKWVNAHGGINGHPVKLIIKDNKNDQALAVSLVKELVEEDHVIAFVSNQDGNLNSGYADYLEEKGIPVLGGSVFLPEPWISSPMFYPQGITAIQQLNAIIQTTKDQGFQNIGSLACAEATQCGAANKLLESLAEDAGLPYVYGAVVSSTAPDYTASCLAAKDAGAKMIVLLVASADQGTKIADDCARQDFSPAWFVPGEAISSGYLSSKSFNNTYNTSPIQPWFSKDPTMKDFHAAMKKYAKGVDLDDPNTMPLTAGDAWASGLMLEKAVELSGATGAPTTADILAGLAKFDNETLGGFAAGLTFTDVSDKTVGCYFTILIKKQKLTLPNGAAPSCLSSF